jgi:photosystem II stability/assembly factor-like uncharacterized protein
MSYFKGFGSGSNSNGQFWYGDYGFLYKKNNGVGGRKNPKYGLLCNKSTYLYNKYKPGVGGVGASSVATRRAKNRLATVCGDNQCGNFYTYLGKYDKYLYNPNGYFVYPRPTETTTTTPTPTPTPTTYTLTSININGENQTIVCDDGTIFQSSDSGNNWTTTNIPNTSLYTNVMSKNTTGTVYQTIVNNNYSTVNNITYTYKNNSWVPSTIQPTFTNTNNTNNIISISSSYDGRYQTIIQGNIPSSITTNISSDYGDTWTQSTDQLPFTLSLSINSIGDYQLSAGAFYPTVSIVNLSINYGDTWTPLTLPQVNPSNDNTSISACISGDNSVLLVGDFYGYISYSYDLGSTWNKSTINPDPSLTSIPIGVIKSSNNGNKLVAINAFVFSSGSGYLYISNDKGVTWNAPSGINPNYWTSVDISSSGQVITALTNTSYYYESTDGGVTWSSKLI